jgi:GTP cyclohydrolase II
MFTYLNPEVRERLIRQGSLIRIDGRGREIDPRAQPPAAELALNILGPIPLPIEIGDVSTQVDWYASVRSTELSEVESLAGTLRESGGQHLFSVLASSMAVNSVLAVGSPSETKPPLVRVHSSCLTGDVFGSKRCECGPQLADALRRIDADPAGGFLVYMAGHEGRGIGLWAKAATYLLQDAGENTYQANRSLGLPDDSRDFSDAAALLHYFVGNRPMRLLTNNPKKIEDLRALGLDRVEPIKHVIGVSEWNRRYLDAKRDWGHRIESTDLEASPGAGASGGSEGEAQDSPPRLERVGGD